jgi:hypothetical protein
VVTSLLYNILVFLYNSGGIVRAVLATQHCTDTVMGAARVDQPHVYGPEALRRARHQLNVAQRGATTVQTEQAVSQQIGELHTAIIRVQAPTPRPPSTSSTNRTNNWPTGYWHHESLTTATHHIAHTAIHRVAS